LGIVKAKGAVQVLGGVAERKKVKGCTKVELSDDEIRKRVSQLPVAEFVPKNRENLIIMYLFE
jgi:hypothetical protein